MGDDEKEEAPQQEAEEGLPWVRQREAGAGRRERAGGRCHRPFPWIERCPAPPTAVPRWNAAEVRGEMVTVTSTETFDQVYCAFAAREVRTNRNRLPCSYAWKGSEGACSGGEHVLLPSLPLRSLPLFYIPSPHSRRARVPQVARPWTGACGRAGGGPVGASCPGR